MTRRRRRRSESICRRRSRSASSARRCAPSTTSASPSSRNEIFGFLGPNGAGKTTTLKMLMGLIFPSERARRASSGGRSPTRGQAAARLSAREPLLLRLPVGRGAARSRWGACSACRAPSASRRARRAARARRPRSRAASWPLRKYSKGMLQRLGIAQALINDPELVVLDEPMTRPRSDRAQGDPRPHRRAQARGQDGALLDAHPVRRRADLRSRRHRRRRAHARRRAARAAALAAAHRTPRSCSSTRARIEALRLSPDADVDAALARGARRRQEDRVVTPRRSRSRICSCARSTRPTSAAAPSASS